MQTVIYKTRSIGPTMYFEKVSTRPPKQALIAQMDAMRSLWRQLDTTAMLKEITDAKPRTRSLLTSNSPPFRKHSQLPTTGTQVG